MHVMAELLILWDSSLNKMPCPCAHCPGKMKLLLQWLVKQSNRHRDEVKGHAQLKSVCVFVLPQQWISVWCGVSLAKEKTILYRRVDQHITGKRIFIVYKTTVSKNKPRRFGHLQRWRHLDTRFRADASIVTRPFDTGSSEEKFCNKLNPKKKCSSRVEMITIESNWQKCN